MLLDETVSVPFQSVRVRLPHPANFALHKLLISGRRHNDKAGRDREQAAAVMRALQAAGQADRLQRNGRCRAKIGHHNYRVFGTEGYFERIDTRANHPPVIRYNSTRYYAASDLVELDGSFMPYEYADNPQAGGHGGMDYALLDHFFQALRQRAPAPIPLREGLRMTLPGIYAEESARRGGQVLPMRYPWNQDWSAEFPR